MSIISKIVTNINNALSLKLEDYDVKRIVGLAYPYPEKKGDDALIKIVPALYDNEGEGMMLDINDEYAIMIYHKLSSLNYSLVPNGKMKAFGDNFFQQMIADAYMIIWAKRTVVEMQADDLNDLIVNAIPNQINDLAPGVERCIVNPTQSDFDFISIFRREFQSVNYFLKPEHILIQIKYRATCLIKTNCIT